MTVFEALKYIFFTTTYKVFHGFGQAKFAHGSSILGSSPAASKNNAQIKSGQN